MGVYRRYFYMALLGLLTVPAQAGAPVVQVGDGNVNERLQRLERLMDNQGLLDLFNQIQQLQAQVQKLNGQLELQGHKLDLLEQQQQELAAIIESNRAAMAEPGSTNAFLTDGDDPFGAIEEPISTVPADTTTTGEAADVALLPDAGEERRRIDNAAVEGTIDATTPLPGGGDPARERERYDAAFTLLKQARYADAATAFRDFRRDYPNSTLAANAQYWLGEAYYVQRDFERAIAAYEQIPADFQGDAKVPDALLKIGFSYDELGDLNSARTTLQQLRQQYPNTTAARLADDRLQRLSSRQ